MAYQLTQSHTLRHELDGQWLHHVAHEQNYFFSHGGNWRSCFSQLGGASPAFFSCIQQEISTEILPSNFTETLLWNTNKTLRFQSTLHFFDTKALFDDFVAEEIMTINDVNARNFTVILPVRFMCKKGGGLVHFCTQYNALAIIKNHSASSRTHFVTGSSDESYKWHHLPIFYSTPRVF